jgi:hypothetical protein
MAQTKVTFTLDRATINRINDAAERLAKPKSEVVREAVHEFHEHLGKLSETERARMLLVFDDLVPKIPFRPTAEAAREIGELRRARRAGGRRSAKAGKP